MDLIQVGVSVTGSKKKIPLRQSQGRPGMGLAAAAAGRCSLHLYMITKHKFGDVTKFRIIISNKPRNPRKTSILPRRYGLSLFFCPFISKFLLFLIHFCLQSCWSRSHTFIPLYFFGEAPYFFGIGL
jgi:hypothetical protein